MSFVADFLLPLVTGGPLRVGQPIGPRRLAGMIRASGHEYPERLADLASARQQRARLLLPDLPAPPLDETTIRLGAAVHNLLALGPLSPRPRLAARVVAATEAFAALGSPATAEEAV